MSLWKVRMLLQCRRVLAVVAFAWFVSGASAAETRYLTHLRVDKAAELKPESASISSAGFSAEKGNGRIWVVFYFLGALTDESQLGGLGLSALPDGVPVNLGNATLTFNSPNMAIPEIQAGKGLVVEVAGTPITFDENDLREMLGDEAANLALSRPSSLRQLVQIRHYDIPADEPTAMLLEVLRLENMQPLALEIAVGQGPIPPELVAFEQAMNGNWFNRNRVPTIIIGSIVLGGLWLLRRLRA